MSEKPDIELYSKLQRLILLFQRVNQLSWISDQTKKRYPTPDLMNGDEMEALVRSYLALGMDLEAIYRDWLKLYEEYKNEK